jgi:hypothetical protein
MTDLDHDNGHFLMSQGINHPPVAYPQSVAVDAGQFLEMLFGAVGSRASANIFERMRLAIRGSIRLNALIASAVYVTDHMRHIAHFALGGQANCFIAKAATEHVPSRWGG